MRTTIAILKVLAGHPEGCAMLDVLKRDLAILSTSGRDWSDRIARLAAHAGNVRAFGDNLIERGAQGWRITEAGRMLLAALESAAATGMPMRETPVPEAVPAPPQRRPLLIAAPPTQRHAPSDRRPSQETRRRRQTIALNRSA